MPIKRPCLYQKCPVEAALGFIGGKWRPLILALLLTGPRRFNELRRELTGISARVLTGLLRDLEAAGLVARKVIPSAPPQVEYSLTPLGTTLEPLLTELRRWGQSFALHLQRQAHTLTVPPERQKTDGAPAA